MEIGEKLKAARVTAQLTQEQVAEKIMVSRQTVSNWENGKSLPDIISVMNLSDLYGATLDELLKGDQKMKEKMEMDINKAKNCRRVLLTTGILVCIVVAVYITSKFVGGDFYAFCEAAVRWVLMGIGLACVLAYANARED